MKAEIIAVGTELLMGQIINTNAVYIARQLSALGIDSFFQTVVGDNESRIKQLLELASIRSDIIILCGGLGPTEDDITKHALAAFLNLELIIDEQGMTKIQNWHKSQGRPMSENNRRQALVIENSQVFVNNKGLALGFAIQQNEVTYIVLPGPPFELEPMFQEYAYPLLAEINDVTESFYSRYYHFFGIGESRLVTEISDLINEQVNPTIAPYASKFEVTIRVTTKANSEPEADLIMKPVVDEIMSRVGDYCYGEGEMISLASTIIEKLNQSGRSLALAESLTGGLASSRLVEIANASRVFKGGITAYTKEAKETVLGVNSEIIDAHGMVSSECAIAMAENAKQLLSSDYGLSFTGVAGPNQMEGQEVGTVYIGLAMPDGPSEAFRFKFNRDRNGNRELSVANGYNILLNKIN